MNGQKLCFVGIIFAVVCIAGTHSNVMSRLATSIPNIPCSQKDLINLMGKCMFHFTKGHGLPVINQMRKNINCDASIINCTAVMQTRVCIASLPNSDLSPACRPFINQVSDYQLGIFDIPCRVQHLRTQCMGFFERHGLTQF